MFIGLQNEREWVRFCNDVLERPDLLDDARFSSNSGRVQHREALDAAITSAFVRYSADDVHCAVGVVLLS